MRTGSRVGMDRFRASTDFSDSAAEVLAGWANGQRYAVRDALPREGAWLPPGRAQVCVSSRKGGHPWTCEAQFAGTCEPQFVCEAQFAGGANPSSQVGAGRGAKARSCWKVAGRGGAAGPRPGGGAGLREFSATGPATYRLHPPATWEPPATHRLQVTCNPQVAGPTGSGAGRRRGPRKRGIAGKWRGRAGRRAHEKTRKNLQDIPGCLYNARARARRYVSLLESGVTLRSHLGG